MDRIGCSVLDHSCRPRIGRAIVLAVASLLLPACTDDGSGPGGTKSGQPFFWGTATAAYQVEGGIEANDWWAFEQLPGRIDGGQHCGAACDQWHRFAEDFALAGSLGHNAYRLSLEWSRIEPERDRYDPEAIRHYHEVLAALRRHGLTPFLTLHHFTHPLWVLDPRQPAGSDLNAWLNEETLNEFVEFAGDMAAEFGGEVDWWTTINEPTVLASFMYLAGGFPTHSAPLSLEEGRQALLRMLRAHAAAYHAIHGQDAADADGDGESCQVGLAHHIRVTLPADPQRAEDVAGARQVDYVVNQMPLDVLIRGMVDANADGDYDDRETDPPEGHYPELAGTMDYIGLNYYSRQVVIGLPDLPFLRGIPQDNPDPAVEHNEMGWEVSPAGFLEVLRRLGAERLPVVVLENGIPDADDDERPRFLVEHVAALQQAMAEGVDVRGYLHWSLLDNFEWTHGFGPRFGLVAVDYATQQRTPRPSAELYREIIERGGVTEEMRRRVGAR